MAETLDDPGLAARVVGLGAEGYSAREIAARLGLSMAELAALEGADAGFAQAMARAAVAERAWWDGAPRDALIAGLRFDHAAWREAMRTRFEDVEAAARARARDAVPYSRTLFVPCNGNFMRADGSCPHAEQDTRDWPERAFDGRQARPCLPEDDESDDDLSDEDDRYDDEEDD